MRGMLLLALLALLCGEAWGLRAVSRRLQVDARVRLATVARDRAVVAVAAAVSERSNSPPAKRSIFDFYHDSITHHPVLTKMVSSAFVASLGDLVVQFATTPKLQQRRTLVFGAVAAAYIAPITHLWFGWLDSVSLRLPHAQWKKALLMLLVDQTVGALLVSSLFFYAFELVQLLVPPYSSARGPLAIVSAAVTAGTAANRKNLWPTLLANWSCWPLINFANFLWIPVQYRVLFANVAAVFWNMFLSNIANK